jgi:hypothetical protein
MKNMRRSRNIERTISGLMGWAAKNSGLMGLAFGSAERWRFPASIVM